MIPSTPNLLVLVLLFLLLLAAAARSQEKQSNHAACFSALHKKLISITTTMKQRTGILWQ
jgi:uncharacterized membrane protein affecting hemolysin expression